MKILRVIASMDPKSGGPCQGIRNTAASLENLGVGNEVVCLDSPNSDFIGKDSFKIHALGPAANPWVYSKLLLPWLIDNVRKFDAIIVHGLWLYPSHAVRRAMKVMNERNMDGKDVPWYIMPHGMLDPYFQNAPDRKFKAIRNTFYWKIIESKVVQNATGILFTCQQELLLARETFKPYKPAQEINVGYGIQPPPDFSVEMQNSFEHHFPGNFENGYFLFLSRIHPKKGVDNLVNAYSRLLGEQKLGTTAVPDLVIVGPGMDTEFGENLLDLVTENELLKNKVHFPGMLSGNEKWGAFYGCEAFILPSHQENFGIAVAEALACEAPVLISDKINIWREIKDAGGGIIRTDSQEGTYEMLASWLALSANQKTEMRIKAFEAYTQYFKINDNIQNLVKALFPSFESQITSTQNA